MEWWLRTGFLGSYMDGFPPERIPLSPPALCVLLGDGDDVVETAVAMFWEELIQSCRSSPREAMQARREDKTGEDEGNELLGPTITRTLHDSDRYGVRK